MKLEVLITSSSRPQLFPFFWESFKRMCIIREKPKVTVHEDFVFPEESKKVVEYLKRLNEQRGENIIIDHDDPPMGLGNALTHYYKRRVEAEYMFYMQEDWEFERPIDIDQILWVMDRNPHINLVFFNKIKNNGSINKQKQQEFVYDGLPMCCYHAWAFLPGIWRTNFVRHHMKNGFAPERPEGNFTNRFGNHETRTPVDYVVKNMGTYIYGKQGESRYIRHLGNNWRMAKWRLEGPRGDLRPGGNHNPDTMDLPYMAPWVPYPKRPVQGGDYPQRKLNKILNLQEEPNWT